MSRGFRLRNGWHGWVNPHDEPGETGGRFSLYLCDEEDANAHRKNLHGEWNVAPRFKAVGFSFTLDDEDATLGLYGWLASLYLSTGRWRYRGSRERGWRRELDAYVSRENGGTLNLWTDTHDSSNPRQYGFSWFRLKNRLLGRTRREKRLVAVHDVMVRIPGDETEYPVNVRLETWTLRRPRWPFPSVHHHADLEVMDDGGIPYEGKGENAWDVGGDATFAMSCSARTVGDAVGKLIGSIVDYRTKYGWRGGEAPTRVVQRGE